MSLKLYFLLLFVGKFFACCPKDGSQGSNGQCYFAIIYNDTFNRAEHFCANFNGHLASISNAFDNNVVTNMARNNLMNAENIWLGGVYDGEMITWNDGSPDGYHHFGKNVEAGNIVLSLSTGLWSTTSWNANVPFICVVKDSTSTTVAPNTTPSPTEACPLYPPCPADWTYSPEFKSCYKTVFNVDLADGEEQCKLMGSHLASIHTEEENQLVVDLIKTGFSVSNFEAQPLIGGKRTGLGLKDWIWLDGSAFNYTNWADGQPDNASGNEYCMEIFADPWLTTPSANSYLWKWNDYPCDARYRVALCKQAAKY